MYLCNHSQTINIAFHFKKKFASKHVRYSVWSLIIITGNIEATVHLINRRRAWAKQFHSTRSHRRIFRAQPARAFFVGHRINEAAWQLLLPMELFRRRALDWTSHERGTYKGRGRDRCQAGIRQADGLNESPRAYKAGHQSACCERNELY